MGTKLGPDHPGHRGTDFVLQRFRPRGCQQTRGTARVCGGGGARARAACRNNAVATDWGVVARKESGYPDDTQILSGEMGNRGKMKSSAVDMLTQTYV